MVKFAHISDVHLGGWKQPEMRDLNFKSFEMTIDRCLKEKVEFVLIAGDLFDTAYPPIDILKETFGQLRKLKDARIPCFIIAGSHDYSASGKTFLDVIEKAGFCKNVASFNPETEDEASSQERNEQIILHPVVHGNVAIYGYPGKKSSLEINDLRKVKLNDSPGMFKILMLHTTLDKAKGTLPIDAIEADLLPKADYYAMGHLHIDFRYKNFVYPGPIFPNNFQELEDLQQGSFYIVDTAFPVGEQLQKVNLKIKDILPLGFEIRDAHTGTEKIMESISERDLTDKIVLLRVKGELENGKNSDIKFQKIEEFCLNKGAYFVLKNTHDLKTKEVDLDIENEAKDSDEIEDETIKSYSNQNPSDFNKKIPELMNSFSIEKMEGETTDVYKSRLMETARMVLDF